LFTCFGAPQADRAKNRLQFLLKQAEIFQHFVPSNAKAAKESKKWVSAFASTS
jgi:hypothetical protein